MFAILVFAFVCAFQLIIYLIILFIGLFSAYSILMIFQYAKAVPHLMLCVVTSL